MLSPPHLSVPTQLGHANRKPTSLVELDLMLCGLNFIRTSEGIPGLPMVEPSNVRRLIRSRSETTAYFRPVARHLET